jgi:hypothetical protein
MQRETALVTGAASRREAVSEVIVRREEIAVEHVRIESPKPFVETKAALESSVPQLDPEIAVLLREGESARAREALERGPELAIFLARDHGGLLRITGRPRNAVQYEIGNPLTASRMTQHQLPAALYAPLRVVLYESEGGGTIFEFDKPSSLFGQFGDERVTTVGRELDAKLERALRRAAG